MAQNYFKRLLPFVCIRLSMNKWLDSKHLRPAILKWGGKDGQALSCGQQCGV